MSLSDQMCIQEKLFSFIYVTLHFANNFCAVYIELCMMRQSRAAGIFVKNHFRLKARYQHHVCINIIVVMQFFSYTASGCYEGGYIQQAVFFFY